MNPANFLSLREKTAGGADRIRTGDGGFAALKMAFFPSLIGAGVSPVLPCPVYPFFCHAIYTPVYRKPRKLTPQLAENLQ